MKSGKIKVLAVDDNPDNLTSLKALIADNFFEASVFTALSGNLALEIAKKEEPDVILLDVVMPGMDGFEVCRKLKSNRALREIPVVFVTAFKDDRESRIRAMECGGDAFLAKPVNESELTAQIRAMAKIRKANIEKSQEKERLARLVREKTRALRKENEERKKSEQDLLEAQRLANIGSFEFSLERSALTCTDEGLRICGTKREEFFGAPDTIIRCIHPDDRDSALQASMQAVSEKRATEADCRLIRPDGEERTICVRYIPVMDASGKPRSIRGTVQDITERIEAQKALKESEEKYRLLVTQMMQGLAVHEIILDRDGKPADYRFLDINPSFEKITGLKRENIIGKTVREILPEIESDWIEKCGEVALTREPKIYENYSKELGRYYEVVAYSPQPKQFAVIFTDITERKAAADALKESEQKYSSYIENAPDGVFVADEKGNYIEVNRAASEITGYSRKELLQMTLRDITSKGYKTDAMNLFDKLSKDGAVNGVLQYKHKNGTNRWWTIAAVKLTENRFLGFSKDVTDRKKAEEELVHLSYHDQLTGLYNRRFFEEELKRLDTRKNLPLSIVMGDINGLKFINDSFGHETGDNYLRKTAGIIQKACRADDLVARLGGDEFVIALTKSGAPEAGNLIKRIEDLIAKEKPGRIQFSVSFGYAAKVSEEQQISHILANAENNMYIHKVYEHASTRSKIVDVIMNALFEKSNRESQHSKRVSALCGAIAAEMNFEKDDINQIRIAGLVHDIGKIGIDEKILNKAGRLSDFEWSELKKHPEAGWRILSSMAEFSEIAKFVLDHHEKFDGSGYPNGLKGEEIPIEARIITVSDSYDAMTSRRSYRDAISKEEALKEIIRCSGTHFDPEVVDVFVKKVFPKLNASGTKRM